MLGRRGRAEGYSKIRPDRACELWYDVAVRLENLVDAASEVLLPSLCLHCCEPLSGTSRSLCQACWSRVVPLSESCCHRCGGPCDEPDGVCLGCLDKPPPQAATYAWGEYDGVLRTAVLALKHRGRDELAGPLAARLSEALSVHGWSRLLGIVTWVPSHPLLRLRRGWSAAQLVSRSLARELSLPLSGLLTRRGLGRQARRSRSQRLRLPASSFVARRGARRRCAGHVLLVDDVITTGATLHRAAAALLDEGVEAVYCVALARTPDPRRLP